MEKSHSSTSVSVTGPNAPPIPALLNTQSRRPNSSHAYSTAASTSASSVTSVRANRTRSPAPSAAARAREPAPALGIEVRDHHPRPLAEKAKHRLAADPVARRR